MLIKDKKKYLSNKGENSCHANKDIFDSLVWRLTSIGVYLY